MTQLETLVADEVQKLKGVSYPVKAGFLQRVFTKMVPVSKLHPNPNDEFCFPDIGPSYEIISQYVRDYRTLLDDPGRPFSKSVVCEPLYVEKIRPDGYMILNGHHRWAAALKAGVYKIPVKIVDLTQESDIRKMLKSSVNSKRAVLDLDETVFRTENDPYLEQPLSFLLSRHFKERLRLGIPSLFATLKRNGYDIWIYTANYYSLKYLQYYFKHYGITVTGIVTGTSRKGPAGTDTRKELEKRLSSVYKTTAHIDSKSVMRITAGSGDFEEFRLSGDEKTWPQEVADAFSRMNKNE